MSKCPVPVQSCAPTDLETAGRSTIRRPHPRTLLTADNPKVMKGMKVNYWTFVLHLAPAKLSGFNVCSMATKGCKAACLNTAGRGGIMAGHGILTESDIESGIVNSVQKARIRRTRWFFEHRAEFMGALVQDIGRAIRRAEKKGFVPVFRLNGTSDIRWESVPVDGARNVMELFPNVQFYDYTKIPNRKNLPANYHLTFSLAESNSVYAFAAMANGMNIAAVFRSRETIARYQGEGGYMGAPVFVGDDTDLRFLDPKGHIVGLYAKGHAKRDRTGFVQD